MSSLSRGLKIACLYKGNVSGRVTLLPGTDLKSVSFNKRQQNERVFFLKGRDTRCDKSQRHVAATSRLVCTVAATGRLPLFCRCGYVARIQTSLNSCERQIAATNSVAATMIFTCHTRRFVAATCRGDVSQRFVASCVSALKCQFDEN